VTCMKSRMRSTTATFRRLLGMERGELD
jgi:hypothetical protein